MRLATGLRQFFFIIPSSFFMPSSFFIESLDMESFDRESFFMLSLDIVSFFMPSSLPILSWAKAAGGSARLRERTAAASPSERREVIWVFLRLNDKRLVPPFDRRCGGRPCYAPD